MVDYFKLSRFFIYLVPLAIIFVTPSTLFPFIVGKYVWFRTVTDIALITFLVGLLISPDAKKYEERLKAVFRSKLTLIVSIFTVVFVLAGFFGVAPQASFWSNFERGEGGFQLIHLYILFVLLSVLFEREHWHTIFRVSLVAAVIMILYGTAAAAQIGGFIGPYRSAVTGELVAPTIWGRLTTERFHGSLGNSAYVSVYLIFILFYALHLFIEAKVAWRKFVLAGLMILYFLFFWLAQTRGTFMGFLAAVFVGGVYFIFTSKGSFRRWGAIALGMLIVAGAAMFSARDSAFVKSLPGSRVLHFTLSEASPRFWTWGSAIKGWKERPILGWGPENFSVVFDKYFDPRHFVPGKSTETWFDRAHSIYFDYLAETGVIGLSSFLAIFVVLYWLIIKSRNNGSSPFAGLSPFQQAAVVAIPVTYLVQGIVLFDILPTYLNLFLLFGFINYLTNDFSADHA